MSQFLPLYFVLAALIRYLIIPDNPLPYVLFTVPITSAAAASGVPGQLRVTGSLFASIFCRWRLRKPLGIVVRTLLRLEIDLTYLHRVPAQVTELRTGLYSLKTAEND